MFHSLVMILIELYKENWLDIGESLFQFAGTWSVSGDMDRLIIKD